MTTKMADMDFAFNLGLLTVKQRLMEELRQNEDRLAKFSNRKSTERERLSAEVIAAKRYILMIDSLMKK